jgi:hypothetical protein
MNLLLMNLSHYIRRPGLILLQLLFMCMVLPMTFASQKSNFWMPSLCGFAMIGGIVYGYQMEILSKPFSFILPGHRLIFRRLIFTVQAFWLLLGVMLILIFWPQDMLHRIFGSILLAAGGSLAFWLGKSWADKTRQPQAMIGFMVPIIIFGSMLSDSATVEKVLFNPLVIVVIAVLGCIVTFRMWHRLGQLSLFASYCGLQNIVIFSFSQKRLQQVRQQQFAKSPGAGAEDFIAGVETFFLKRIEYTRHNPVASFVYGAIYQGLGPTLQCQLRSKGWSVIWMFAMFLLFGYYGKLGDSIIWILFLFPLFWTDIQVHSTLLLTRGRSQRYIAAMSWLLFTTITTLGFIFIGLGLTQIVEPYMPAIHLRSLNAAFHALDWHMWYFFAAGVPLLTTLNLLFRGSTYFYMSCCILMGGMFALSFSTSLWQGRIPGTWIAPIVLAAWTLFATYLYRVCFQKSLATQK